MKIELFIPCFIDQVYPDTAFNTVKVLEKLGCKVKYNPNQTCCGQPAFNSGFWGTFAIKFEAISTAMAEQKVNNALTTGADYIISTDMSCLMHLQGYISRNRLPIKVMHIADVLASGW